MEIRILDILLPREVAFFEYMNEQAGVFHEACKTFKRLADGMGKMPQDEMRALAADIKDAEMRGDDIERHIIEELDSTFITPLDREDIHSIAINIDRSLDLLNDASQRLEMYGIRRKSKGIAAFASIILDISGELKKLIAGLEDKEGADPAVRSIHRLENDADYLFHTSLVELFEGRDPVEIIKYKDVYECLEGVVDSVHHVAKLVNGVIVKHG
jgi:hypothetical protein